ncbi:MAG: radical SAM protein [Candidatus Paceibacterota bacterium]|jgi:uncharacterized protein
MELVQHRLFKIQDGDSVIIYVPTMRKVYRVEANVAETIPDFVTAPTSTIQKEVAEEPNYLFTGATLMLTNQCKLGCIYCFGGYVPRPTETITMPTEVVRATVDHLIKSARDSGKRKVGAWMFGGEPTLPWTTLVGAVQYLHAQASEQGLESSAGITTNGCMSSQKARWLAENMDNILLSVDGPKDIHDAQRGKSFDRVFDAATEIYQIAPHKLRFRSTISAASVHRLTEMVRFFGERFPGCVQTYEPLFAMGRAKVNPLAQPPVDSLFLGKFTEASEVAKTLNVSIRTSLAQAWRTTGSAFCGAAGKNFTITYDGRVVSCHRMAGVGANDAALLFCFGQYDPKQQAFVFDADRYRHLRQFNVRSIPDCQNCFAQFGCKGDCPANKAEVSPEAFWKERSYRCEAIREFSKNLLRHILDH